VRIIEWTGGNAPDKQATLKIDRYSTHTYQALWDPGYCGCPDCHCIVGYGPTPEAAVIDYWEQWEEQ